MKNNPFSLRSIIKGKIRENTTTKIKIKYCWVICTLCSQRKLHDCVLLWQLSTSFEVKTLNYTPTNVFVACVWIAFCTHNIWSQYRSLKRHLRQVTIQPTFIAHFTLFGAWQLQGNLLLFEMQQEIKKSNLEEVFWHHFKAWTCWARIELMLYFIYNDDSNYAQWKEWLLGHTQFLRGLRVWL